MTEIGKIGYSPDYSSAKDAENEAINLRNRFTEDFWSRCPQFYDNETLYRAFRERLASEYQMIPYQVEK